MEQQNVVVHYLDGRVLKGSTNDFFAFPAKVFHLLPAGAGPKDELVEVHIADLKAVFFVRDLAGDSKHVPRNAFEKGEASFGRRVSVSFADGEVMVGWTMGSVTDGEDFILFPADTGRNTLRVYVVAANVKETQELRD